ncbi:MAG TPA: DivIVA domain-containing protein [Clostridiales bacterium]|nr:DivIVA domain-containing protein [Clostridiales bacterium]
MRTADEIRTMEFQKATVGGYKQTDVEMFLEEVAQTVEELNQRIAEYENRINQLNKKIQEYHDSESSIQNVLLSAQRLADQIVKEANDMAEDIVGKAKEKATNILADAEQKAQAKLDEANAKATSILNSAVAKSESMISAAHDSVARQQLLFDKLKVEVSRFKNSMMPKFKELLNLLSTLPDEVPFGPQRAAEAVVFEFEKAPDFKEIVAEVVKSNKLMEEPLIQTQPHAETEDQQTQAEMSEPPTVQETPEKPVIQAQQTANQPDFVNAPDEEQPKIKGFKIIVDENEDDEALSDSLNFVETDSEPEKQRGLFRKRK